MMSSLISPLAFMPALVMSLSFEHPARLGYIPEDLLGGFFLNLALPFAGNRHISLSSKSSRCQTISGQIR